jgi:hypothetical protein
MDKKKTFWQGWVENILSAAKFLKLLRRNSQERPRNGSDPEIGYYLGAFCCVIFSTFDLEYISGGVAC